MTESTRGALSARSEVGWWWLLPIVLVLGGCAYATLAVSSGLDLSGHAIGTDDAYISYRYSKNWAEGLGLVFNPGERVEGYTNLFYVLLMGIPFKIGVDVYRFSATLNALFALGAMLLLAQHLRRRHGEWPAFLGAVLFALSPSIWLWASSGLETALVLLLQVAIWTRVERLHEAPSARRLALLCLPIALLVMTRADGFVTGGIATGYLVLKGRRREAAIAGATVAGVLGCVIGWRLSYYGEIWPNTYYAKVTATLLLRLKSAFKELGGIGARQGLAIYLLAIAFQTARFGKTVLERGLGALREARYDLCFPLIFLAYWLYVGGDNFEDRFLIVMIPIGISHLLELVLLPAGRAVGNFVFAFALTVQLAVVVRDPQYAKSLAPKYDLWITLGKFLARERPGRVLATSAAGKIPYFSGLVSVDMLGLNDKYIARLKPTAFTVGHSKYDPDYVLRRGPQLIAGYFQGAGLDIDCGMTESKYGGAGFRVAFVVNDRPPSKGALDILDVRGKTRDEIIMLANTGWRFTVLELQK